jgi:hypothetical protein
MGRLPRLSLLGRLHLLRQRYLHFRLRLLLNRYKQ